MTEEAGMKDLLERERITMPTDEAKAAAADYLAAVRTRHNREDAAILRGLRALAKGHPVIDLPAVIRAGGEHENGLPKLAVATSSHEFVYVERHRDGSLRFIPRRAADLSSRQRRGVYAMPGGTLAEREPDTVPYRGSWYSHPWRGSHRAMVPIVPPRLRPAHSLDGYVTLFEVDRWDLDPTAPVDPALLKHLGGDLYAVLAVWDLTALERAVLNGRTRA